VTVTTGRDAARLVAVVVFSEFSVEKEQDDESDVF